LWSHLLRRLRRGQFRYRDRETERDKETKTDTLDTHIHTPLTAIVSSLKLHLLLHHPKQHPISPDDPRKLALLHILRRSRELQPMSRQHITLDLGDGGAVLSLDEQQHVHNSLVAKTRPIGYSTHVSSFWTASVINCLTNSELFLRPRFVFKERKCSAASSVKSSRMLTFPKQPHSYTILGAKITQS